MSVIDKFKKGESGEETTLYLEFCSPRRPATRKVHWRSFQKIEEKMEDPEWEFVGSTEE